MCEFCQSDPCHCDRDDKNPVDANAETWARIYANPDYDGDHDYSMN